MSSRAQFHEKLREAVDQVDLETSLKVVETFLNDQMPAKAKISRAEHHPIFQVIPRAQQFAIHDGDAEQLMHFVRTVLSTVAVSKGLLPVSWKADVKIWHTVVRKLRNLDRPERVTKDQRDDAARRSRQLQRAEAGPRKGSNPSPPKHGAGNTKNARKRQRRESSSRS